MKNELFNSALQAILCTSDMAELAENGQSFLLDTLMECGIDEEEACDRLFLISSGQACSAIAYLRCFEEFGVEEEFDAYCENEGNFEYAMEELRDLIVDAASNDFEDFPEIEGMIQ